MVTITKIELLLFCNLVGNTAFTASTADAPHIATPAPETKPSVMFFLKIYERPIPKHNVNRTIKKIHTIGKKPKALMSSKINLNPIKTMPIFNKTLAAKSIPSANFVL